MKRIKNAVKNKKSILILAICLVCIVTAGIAYGCKIIKENKEKAASKELVSKIDGYMDGLTKDKNFSGTVLVAKKDKMILCKGYGMANYELDVKNTQDTKFKLGSITEQFTAAAILQLQDKGVLSIEDTVSKYIPRYPRGEKITIYQLLTHTAGIPNYMAFENYKYNMCSKYPVQTTIDSFKNKPLEFEPGTQYKFTNSDYILLGAIIEKVSGKGYSEYLNEYIFKPLKMNNTGYFDGETLVKNRASGYEINKIGKVANVPYYDISHLFSAMGITSTVEDLYIWDRALYNGKFLSAKAKEIMFKPSDKQKYGFGWFSDVSLGRKIVWQHGSAIGYTTSITRYYNDDAVIIVLSNKTFDNSVIEKISSNIAVYLFE